MLQNLEQNLERGAQGHSGLGGALGTLKNWFGHSGHSGLGAGTQDTTTT